MKPKISKKRLYLNRAISSMVVFLSFTTLFCASDSDAESLKLKYTGRTAPTQITRDMLTDFSETIVSQRASMTHLLGNTTNNSSEVQNYQISSSKNLVRTSARIHTLSDTISGNCGGYLRSFITIDDQNDDFSGNLNFESFCEDNTRIDGRVDIIEGQVYESEQNFQLKMNSVTTTYPDNTSFTEEGIYKINSVNGYGPRISFSIDHLLILEHSNNLVHKIEDFSYVQEGTWANSVRGMVSSGRPYREARIRGKLYHAEEGLFEIETTKPLIIFNFTDSIPINGEFVYKGANNSQLKVTILCESAFQRHIDEDGDNIYEESSRIFFEDEASPCEIENNLFDDHPNECFGLETYNYGGIDSGQTFKIEVPNDIDFIRLNTIYGFRGTFKLTCDQNLISSFSIYDESCNFLATGHCNQDSMISFSQEEERSGVILGVTSPQGNLSYTLSFP